MSNVNTVNGVVGEPVVFLTPVGFLCPTSDLYVGGRGRKPTLVARGELLTPRRPLDVVVASGLDEAASALSAPEKANVAVYRLTPPGSRTVRAVTGCIKVTCAVLLVLGIANGILGPIMSEASSLQFMGKTMTPADWKIVDTLWDKVPPLQPREFVPDPRDQEISLRYRQARGALPFDGDKQ